MIRLRFLAAALGVCAFSACAGTTLPVAAVSSNGFASALTRAPRSLDAANASEAHRGQDNTRLYVSNWNNTFTFPPASPAPVANSVSVFDLSRHDAPLTPVPVGPLLGPTSVAFDHVGKLYVSNSAAQSITVFDTRHGNAELPTIAGLTNPQGIAIDRHGKLYVSNGAEIDVFDTRHGNVAMPPVARGQIAAGPIALDANGKLYVPGNIGQIRVLDTERGNAMLPPISFAGPGAVVAAPFIDGMTVDAGGKLYAATSENTIMVFDTSRSNAPLPTITGNGLLGPAGLVEDERGRLYVANDNFGSGNSILVFDTRDHNTLLGTIVGGGMEGVYSLALQ